MDQIDSHHQPSHSDTDIRQYISNNISFPYSLNYPEQYLEEDHHHHHLLPTKSTNEHEEQNENESNFVPIVYKKRVRTKFNQEQLDVLEATFQQHRYPTVDIVDDLVEQLNLPTQKITIWFQNRRARLKKTQQKLDVQSSSDKEIPQQYDSGIHLDEDISSHDSPASSPLNPLPPPFLMNPSPYYLPHSSYPFYNPMWSNLNYPIMSNTNPMSYNFLNYPPPGEMPSSFMFQDLSNYPRSNEFHGDL